MILSSRFFSGTSPLGVILIAALSIGCLTIGGLGCSGSGGISAEGFTVDPAAPKIEEKEAKELRKKFARAQIDEMKSLRDRHSKEFKELSERQKRELTEWESRSTQDRKEFIREHRGEGKLIREHVKAGQSKHDALRKMMNDERRARREEQESQRRSAKVTQEANAEVFKAYLEQGKKPPENIWPGAAPLPSSN